MRSRKRSAHAGLFKPVIDSILYNGDAYMVLADYEAYINCQERVGALYADKHAWAKKSIPNVANMGRFSSDRTIMEYAREIWGIEPSDKKPLITERKLTGAAR